jgi:uncharacterized protein YbjT (DUF2867 family)
MPENSGVFVAGGTGYIGRPFVAELLRRDRPVKVLVRPGSEKKLPAGATAVSGDALRAETFAGVIAPAKTFVQLVGVAHPSPAKAAEFRSVDLASLRASVEAAVRAGIDHFVYLSVAKPAPAIMKAYAAVRAEGEAMVGSTGMRATFLRPWYVLGPGHRWPYVLKPFYYVCERLPSTRETALRLGFVTHAQMTAALLRAVEEPAPDFRVLNVPDIRAAA